MARRPEPAYPRDRPPAADVPSAGRGAVASRAAGPEDDGAAADRLRRALAAFRAARRLAAAAHRELEGLPPGEAEAYWAAPGRLVGEHLRLAAAEAVAAARACPAAADHRLVAEARRCLAEGAWRAGAAPPASRPPEG